MRKMVFVLTVVALVGVSWACQGVQDPPPKHDEILVELDDLLTDFLIEVQQEVLFKTMPYQMDHAYHVTHIASLDTLVLDQTYHDVTLVGMAIHLVMDSATMPCKTLKKDIAFQGDTVVFTSTRVDDEACLGDAFLNHTIFEENTVGRPGQPITVVPYHRFPLLGLVEVTQADVKRIAEPLNDAIMQAAAAEWVTIDGVIYGVFAAQRTAHVSGLAMNGQTPVSVSLLDAIEGHPVETMSPGLFKGNAWIESIVLPTHLTHIPKEAFRNMDVLKDVYVPAEIKRIGARAFFHTPSLMRVTLAQDSQLETIEKEAFGESSLSHWHIPATVNVMGEQAFYGASDLTLFTDHPSQPVGWHPHWNPDGQSVIFGYQDTVDDGEIRYATTIHNTISILGLSPAASDTDFVLPSDIDGQTVVQIVNGAFLNELRLLSLKIPNTLTAIEQETFKGAERLTTVTFEAGSTLQRIGAGAFWRSGLTAFQVPATVASIAAWAFGETSFLTTFSFEPNSQLQSLGHRAFSNAALTAIHFPTSLTEIGTLAFSMTVDLTTVTFEADSRLETIHPYAFTHSGVQTLQLPASLKHIHSGAFSNTSALTTVTFETGSALETIGDHAFMLSNLTRLEIPISVTTLGDMAFFEATNLTIFSPQPYKPSSWSESWNPSNRPVVWNYQID